MSERTADELIMKLTRKARAAQKVLKVDKTSVTVDRDGVEDKVSKDRVNRAPARLDPDTLRPQDTDGPAKEKQRPKDSTQPPPRRSERHSSKQKTSPRSQLPRTRSRTRDNRPNGKVLQTRR